MDETGMKSTNMQRLFMAYDLTTTPVFIKDEHLILIYTNQSYAELLCIDPRKVINTDGSSIYTPDSLAKSKEMDRMILESDQDYSCHIRIKRKKKGDYKAVLTKRRIEIAGDIYIRGIITCLEALALSDAAADWNAEQAQWTV